MWPPALKRIAGCSSICFKRFFDWNASACAASALLRSIIWPEMAGSSACSPVSRGQSLPLPNGSEPETAISRRSSQGMNTLTSRAYGRRGSSQEERRGRTGLSAST
ncbi:hypothetical protein KCU88_g137, partial [Aureobasidium melanogenum]